jgi:hypothetical protein
MITAQEGHSITTRSFFTPGKDSVPVVHEARWDPGPVWTDAENLAPTGIRSPDRPARSQSCHEDDDYITEKLFSFFVKSFGG